MPTAPNWLLSLAEVAGSLPSAAVPDRYVEPLKHGTMRFGLYGPRQRDLQKPHRQDELYVIVSGSGDFVKNGERRPFKPHDAIFVEAGAEHRFEDFTPDFLAWVIFWGPEGGEG